MPEASLLSDTPPHATCREDCRWAADSGYLSIASGNRVVEVWKTIPIQFMDGIKRQFENQLNEGEYRTTYFKTNIICHQRRESSASGGDESNPIGGGGTNREGVTKTRLWASPPWRCRSGTPGTTPTGRVGRDDGVVGSRGETTGT